MFQKSAIRIPERNIPSRSNAVIIETNRWQPGKCLWIARKEDVISSGCFIIFPFPEYWRSVCHIITGSNNEYDLFVHLSPLTSFFRRETGELEKISQNITETTGSMEGWRFEISHFPDFGREEVFRSLFEKVLNGSALIFQELSPERDIEGVFNLVMHNGSFFYSRQEIEKLEYNDISAVGSFNRIPIEAIE